MGSNLSSKVSCGDIHLYKKYVKSSRRPALKIDKSKIGTPQDFRHTYHVGNNSPVTIDLVDTVEPTSATTKLSETEFMATMAQITDALKSYPTAHSEQLPFTEKEKSSILQISKSTSTLDRPDFSSGFQSRIDAHIVELARARSQQKKRPNNLMMCDRPTVMI